MGRRRRIVAVVGLVVAACSGTDDRGDGSSPPAPGPATATTTTTGARPAPADTCDLPPPEGRFLFTSEGVGGRFDVFTWDSGTAEAVNVTRHPAGELNATWPADASAIAFETDRDGDHEIYLAAPDGRDLRNLTASPTNDQHVAWSPDGRYVAFSSDQPEGFGLLVVEVATGRRRMVAPGGLLPAWSPDGTRIAYSEEQPANDELAVVGADGTGKVLLTDSPGNDIWPSWSPDGRHIAFESQRDGNSEIYRIDADGRDLRRLTDDPLDDQFPTWSPDATQILYQHHGTVHVMNADGTCATAVAGPLAPGQFVSWRPR